jgi:hypothetical protein
MRLSRADQRRTALWDRLPQSRSLLQHIKEPLPDFVRGFVQVPRARKGPFPGCPIHDPTRDLVRGTVPRTLEETKRSLVILPVMLEMKRLEIHRGPAVEG